MIHLLCCAPVCKQTTNFPCFQHKHCAECCLQFSFLHFVDQICLSADPVCIKQRHPTKLSTRIPIGSKYIRNVMQMLIFRFVPVVRYNANSDKNTLSDVFVIYMLPTNLHMLVLKIRGQYWATCYFTVLAHHMKSPR